MQICIKICIILSTTCFRDAVIFAKEFCVYFLQKKEQYQKILQDEYWKLRRSQKQLINDWLIN